MLNRRQLLVGVGIATGCPRTAVAQTASNATIGYLSTLSERQAATQVQMFRRGLAEAGFLEGRNVTIEYRWAEGEYDRLPSMAADLVRRKVGLIMAQAPPAALAAKAATHTTPIVFVVGFDPVAAGLVASLSRPGGNATGMTLFSLPLGQKRLEILRELSPNVSVVAMLINPRSPDSMSEVLAVQAAAEALKLQLKMFDATSPAEIDAALALIVQQRVDALLVGTDPFFINERDQIVRLATRSRLPTIYPFRDYVVAGGLISYGANIGNSYRQAGIYAGRLLKGDKTTELPVMQPTTFELVINLRMANEIGIDIPAVLHARSDEVIE
jgi:putative tryptophan/tyrosine transport system substrate-binding protein